MIQQQGVEKLPPTRGSMHQHVLRAQLQICIWRQGLVPKADRWTRENDEFVPIFTKELFAPDAVVRLVKCGCMRSQFGSRCKCRKDNVVCNKLFECEADKEKCANTEHAGEPELTDDNYSFFHTTPNAS